MNDNEPLSSDEICVVCGKDTTGGRGFMTLHADGRNIALCCPMCKKIYEEDPVKFARKQNSRDTTSKIENILGLHHSE